MPLCQTQINDEILSYYRFKFFFLTQLHEYNIYLKKCVPQDLRLECVCYHFTQVTNFFVCLFSDVKSHAALP